MNMPCQIPIAEYKTIYSVADVERAMESSCSRKNETLQAIYENMKKSGGVHRQTLFHKRAGQFV